MDHLIAWSAVRSIAVIVGNNLPSNAICLFASRWFKRVKRVDWSRTFEAFPFERDIRVPSVSFSFFGAYCEKLRSPKTTPPSDNGWHR
jgi:hypothetical protein